MDKKLSDITEDLRDLNTPDKIACISAAMVDMSADNIIDLLEGLKMATKKILVAEINRAKQSQDQYEKSALYAKELHNKLLNASERL